MDFIIAPDYDFNSTLTFPAAKVNKFVTEERGSTFGAYQNMFDVYGYMRLTKRNTFKITTLRGTSLMWQSHNSCGWDPTGAMSITAEEFIPCRAKINEEFCIDELFDSCYEHLLTWDGVADLDADGVRMINEIIDMLATNAALGARATLTAGQKYDIANVTFDENTPATIKKLFEKTIGTCRGWVELLEFEAANKAQNAHLNVPGLFVEADFMNGKEYQGDPLVLFDNLKANAKPALRTYIDQGGHPGVAGARGGWALFRVTPSIFSAIAKAYNDQPQAISVAGVTRRITKEVMPGVNGAREFYVYKIDGVVIVPVNELAEFDNYLTGATHLAAITVSGNIQLGSSFATLPATRAGEGVGMVIEQGSGTKDWGMYSFLAHALFHAAIADTDLIVATQIYAEPEQLLV